MRLVQTILLSACLLFVGCGSVPVDKKFAIRVNNWTYTKVTDEDFKGLYEKKVVARIGLWTDANFLTNSKLNDNDLENNRDIGIEIKGARDIVGYFSAKTYIVVYVPAGNVTIHTNSYSKHSTKTTINIAGGETKNFYWESAEKPLSESATPNYTNASGTISKYSVQAWNKTLLPKYYVTKSLTQDGIIEFNVSVEQPETIQKFSLNEQLISLSNGKATVKRNLKFGLNEFTFEALNNLGFYNYYKDSHYRISPQEKRAEAQKNAQREKEEKQRILNEQREKRIEAERIAREGDGSVHDKACQKYGLKPSTAGYSECRMRLDLDQKQAEDRQRDYELKQQELAQKQREQESRERAYLQEKKHRESMETLQILQGLQQQQQQPQVQPQQIRTPIQTNCYRVGTNTNCTTY